MAATGGAFLKKQNYTDAGDFVLSFRRSVIFTSLHSVAKAQDLADRSLTIELKRVLDTERREERSLLRDFAAQRPAILGGMLDALVKGMRVYPELDVRPKPRMADFARMGAAIAEGLGAGADVFLAAYAANHRDRAGDQLSGDAVVQGLQALIAEMGHWSGTPSDLLHVLSQLRAGGLRQRLPSNVSVLGRRLTELAPALGQLGI